MSVRLKLPLAGIIEDRMPSDCYTRSLTITLATLPGSSTSFTSNLPFVPGSTVLGSIVCGTAVWRRSVKTTARIVRCCIFNIEDWGRMATGYVLVSIF